MPARAAILLSHSSFRMDPEILAAGTALSAGTAIAFSQREPMTDKRHRPDAAPAEQPEADVASPESASGEAGAVRELPEAAAQRLADQLAELNDRYLRLAAEYDNFRKRSSRERTELWTRAQADLLGRLVDALDDLARFAHVDPAETDAKTIHGGIELVERKLRKELEAAGVRRVDEVGVPFDPHLHEAVTTAPAIDPSQDHTVGAVLQAGYKFGDMLIRPARVQVLTWGGEEGRGTGEG